LRLVIDAALTYAVVSPVRDEAAYLMTTARSLLSQTVRPRAWVIVDDGSADETATIADRLAADHAWISVVRRARRTTRERGGPIVRAFAAGLAALDIRDDIIVKLDGDLQLPAHYFQWVLSVFAREPSAGIVGGTVFIRDGGRWTRDAVGRSTVHGAIKAYRRDCFDDIGGLQESMGWDGIDEYAARSRGWQVFPLSELMVLHYKPRGSKQRWVRARWEEGCGARFMGYGWQGMLVRTVYRSLKERPTILAGLVLAAGYLWSTWTGAPRCDDERAVTLLRAEQAARLTMLVTGRGDLQPALLPRGGPAMWTLDSPVDEHSSETA
jgi:biofilm PGA synthesis N-glycosyltransferase PgaC